MTLWPELRDNLGSLLANLGRFTLFSARLLTSVPASLRHPRLIVSQIYNTGALSLVIIMLSGLFVGMVMGLTGFDLLQRFGSEEEIGAVAALALVKELGPVTTALLFAGRAGTAVTSEIGLMKATDQLAALQMMAVDPIERICAPRLIGGVIALPLLAAIFSVIGLLGAYLIAVRVLHVDPGQFWSELRSAVRLRYVREGIWKSVAFGIACSAIAVYQGYVAQATPEGVGRATTRTVVTSSVAVLILDYIVTAVLM
jgi:phospholipid/cholesterol/gamma-HCH transport system permease protein